MDSGAADAAGAKARTEMTRVNVIAEVFVECMRTEKVRKAGALELWKLRVIYLERAGSIVLWGWRGWHCVVHLVYVVGVVKAHGFAG